MGMYFGFQLKNSNTANAPRMLEEVSKGISISKLENILS